MTLSLKLSLVSPVFFGGAGVQFVVGSLAAAGASPAWMGPANRLSESFLKSRAGRGLVRGGSREFEGWDRERLVDTLGEDGVDALDVMELEELKEAYEKVFEDEVGSTLVGCWLSENGSSVDFSCVEHCVWYGMYVAVVSGLSAHGACAPSLTTYSGPIKRHSNVFHPTRFFLTPDRQIIHS